MVPVCSSMGIKATNEKQNNNDNNKTHKKRCFGYSRLGSRGPSTVTLMARWYVATCGGPVNTVIVRVKLFPEIQKGNDLQRISCEQQEEVGKGPLFTTHLSRWSCGLGLICCHFLHCGGTLLVNQILFKMVRNQLYNDVWKRLRFHPVPISKLNVQNEPALFLL